MNACNDECSEGKAKKKSKESDDHVDDDEKRRFEAMLFGFGARRRSREASNFFFLKIALQFLCLFYIVGLVRYMKSFIIFVNCAAKEKRKAGGIQKED